MLEKKVTVSNEGNVGSVPSNLVLPRPARTLVVLAWSCLGIAAQLQAGLPKPALLAGMRDALTHGLTELANVEVCSDGTAWVFLYDPLAVIESGDVRRTGHRMTAQHLYADGRPISGILVLTDHPGLSDMAHVEPMGFCTGGELLLSCRLGTRDPVRYRLVRLGDAGVTAVSGEIFYSPPGHRAVADPTGDVRTFLPGPRFESCLIDGRSSTLETSSFVNSRLDSVSDYLWRGTATLASTGVGEFALIRGPTSESPSVSVYRLNFSTLGLLDSVHLTPADIPSKVFRDVRLPHPELVPDGDSCWLFTPTWTDGGLSGAKGEPGVLAYRLTRRLLLLGERRTEQAAVRPITAAPAGTRYEVRTVILRKRPDISDDARYYETQAGIDYYGLAPDGWVYFASERDSFVTTLGPSGQGNGTEQR